MNKPTRQDVIHVLIVFVAAVASAAAFLPGPLDVKALVAAIPALLVAGYRAVASDPAASHTVAAEIPTITARIHPEDIQHLTDLAGQYENAAKRLELATVAARGVVLNVPVAAPATPTPANPSPAGVGASWVPAPDVAPAAPATTETPATSAP